MPLPSGAEIKVVGKSGQISLGKRYAGKTLRVERLAGGRIVLTSVAMIPESPIVDVAGAPPLSHSERGLAWACRVHQPRKPILTRC